MSAKEVALNRGLALLNAAGCNFVVLQDGELTSSNDVEFLLIHNERVHYSDSIKFVVELDGETWRSDSPPAVQPGQAAKPKRTQHFRDHPIWAELRAAQVGDVVTATCSSKEEAKRLRGSASSLASALWPKGGYISSVSDSNVVEILRVL